MGQKNQAGSTLSFLLIGGVLVLLFIGGAFVVHQVSTPVAPAVAPIAPGKTDSNENKVAPTDAPAPAQTPEKSATPSQSTTPTVPTATELPQTGPAEQLGALFVVALLTMTAVSYMQSRRLHVSL